MIGAGFSWTLPFQFIGGLTAAALVIGTVVAYSKAGTAQATILLQKERIDTLEGDRTDLQTKMAALSSKVADLTKQNDYLLDITKGGSAAEEIRTLAASVFKQRAAEHEQHEALTTALKAAVAAMRAPKPRTRR